MSTEIDEKKIGNVTVVLSDSIVIKNSSGQRIFDASDCEYGYVCDLADADANLIRVQAYYYLAHFYCYQVVNYEIDCLAKKDQLTRVCYDFCDKPNLMFENLFVGESRLGHTPIAIPVLKSELWSFINKLKKELCVIGLLDGKVDLFEHRGGVGIGAISFYHLDCLLFSLGIEFSANGFRVYNNVFFNSAYENVIPVLNTEGLGEKFVSHAVFLDDKSLIRRIKKCILKPETNFKTSNDSVIKSRVYDALKENESKRM